MQTTAIRTVANSLPQRSNSSNSLDFKEVYSLYRFTGRSCPSRASMLTGRYQHEVGMGWMAEVDEHRPGYRGQIDKEYPTIAEVMKSGDILHI